MSIVEDINSTTNKASDIGERYIKTSHQYFKLKLFQQLSLSASLIAKMFAVGCFLFLGVVFFSVALAVKLSAVFGSTVLGYLTVGFIFLLIAAILYASRERITKLILKKLSLKFFN